MNDILLSNYSLKELTDKAHEQSKPYTKKPINGVIICDCLSIELLEGEKLEKHPYENVFVSNLGRIFSIDKKMVYKQEPDPYKSENYDYLYVRVPYLLKVYRLVAETWCKKPNEKYNIVHHISNNGFDNRVENIMWVTPEQHYEIHPELKKWYK
jgi:hypothetical protein